MILVNFKTNNVVFVFLCLFFLVKKPNAPITYTIIKLSLTFYFGCSLFIPPENIRKPTVFLLYQPPPRKHQKTYRFLFSEGIKREHRAVMCHQIIICRLDICKQYIAWRVTVFRDFLVRIFQHSVWHFLRSGTLSFISSQVYSHRFCQQIFQSCSSPLLQKQSSRSIL